MQHKLICQSKIAKNDWQNKFQYFELNDQTKIIVVMKNNSLTLEFIRVANNDFGGWCCEVIPGLLFQKKEEITTNFSV